MADKRFSVRFDDEALNEDLAHASDAGRKVGERERARLEREGLRADELLPCQEAGYDSTDLAGCVKTYLPQPDGPFGMVFRAWRFDPPVAELACVAFGERHPTQTWRPSVYQVAHRRLHGTDRGPGQDTYS